MTTAQSFETLFNSATIAAENSALNKAHEQAEKSRNTVVFPVHKDVTRTRSDSAYSTYLAVRRVIHDNGQTSYMFGRIVFQYGKRATNAELAEQGHIAINPETQKPVNNFPLSGYRVAFANDDTGKIAFRVDKHGHAAHGDITHLDTAKQAVKQAQFFGELARRKGMRFADFTTYTENKDCHLAHNSAVTTIKRTVKAIEANDMPDFTSMTDEEFAAAFNVV